MSKDGGEKKFLHEWPQVNFGQLAHIRGISHAHPFPCHGRISHVMAFSGGRRCILDMRPV